jgi:hypothetical protein
MNKSLMVLKTFLKWIYRIVSFISLVTVIFFVMGYLFPPRKNKLYDHPISEIDTKQFHTGIFLPDSDEKIFKLNLSGYYIIRDSIYQIEVDAPINQIRKYRITWLNKSEYELAFEESNNPNDIIKKGDKINVKILFCGDNYYKAIARQARGDNLFTIYKVIIDKYALTKLTE